MNLKIEVDAYKSAELVEVESSYKNPEHCLEKIKIRTKKMLKLNF
ncbi:hypothetical protein QMK38_16080 [Lysinibacillus fusiformis]|nr:hypothetical protein [Lysinibacillus fusiformis]